jgi:hypothetical protein
MLACSHFAVFAVDSSAVVTVEETLPVIISLGHIATVAWTFDKDFEPPESELDEFIEFVFTEVGLEDSVRDLLLAHVTRTD